MSAAAGWRSRGTTGLLTGSAKRAERQGTEGEGALVQMRANIRDFSVDSPSTITCEGQVSDVFYLDYNKDYTLNLALLVVLF